jgi:predicted nucleotidyltransferase
VSEILGIPQLNAEYLPPHVIITLKERIAAIGGVGAVVLYGSVVRGEASPKSDIDIMIVPIKKKNQKALKKQVMRILHKIEDEFKLKVSFSLMIYSGKEDPYFIWEAINDGVVIFIRPEMVIDSNQNIKPYALISYSYVGLTNSETKRVQRFLYESTKGIQIDRKNKMEYISPGVILIPLGKSKSITKFFDDMHLYYSLLKIWR